ncbi:MAG: METTL5 family protein [Candidatus Heimdallarchaeaceae archaeon]
MKQKDIEMLLSHLETFSNPKIHLEQYQIPPRLAAMIVYRAFQLGDVKNKIVMDLCCGTGLFAIAAKELGAEVVYGVDIDADALEIAKKNAEKVQVEIIWKKADAREISLKVDTVFMNSPFGVKGAVKDQHFLQAALNNSKVCYSVHLYQEKNIQFLKEYIKKQNKEVAEIIKAEFEIPRLYHFHKKRYHVINVGIIRTL